MSGPRVLLTSATQLIGGASPDVSSWNKSPRGLRLAVNFLNHPGLSFLKANLPVEILEYPTQEQFEKALADPPDILGISFYINETPIALRMAEVARQRGVAKIWAGNYGAYTPDVASHFDQVFSGWGEGAIAAGLGAEPIPNSKIVHPEIYGMIGVAGLPTVLLSGTLFTSRGCPYTCNFCQTPDFYEKAYTIPLEEIDRILWTYRNRGIRGINILDENFGTFRKHSAEVARLLHKHGMRWIALCRVDTLARNFEEWTELGLFGAHLGIESLNDRSLTGAAKRIDHLASIELLERMRRHNMFVQVFYMIGFEEDTPESVRRDVESLKKLDFDIAQIQILTPYPETGQRALIEEKYGIFDRDPSHYNSRNLVWNHPHISPAAMRELQAWADREIATGRRAMRTLSKVGLYFGRKSLNLAGARTLLASLSGSASALRREYAGQIGAAHAWSRNGWEAYEETPTRPSRSAVRA
jgi:radical SAM superfamily enzyme YgiQ (UPF0313 family)